MVLPDTFKADGKLYACVQIFRFLFLVFRVMILVLLIAAVTHGVTGQFSGCLFGTET